MFENLTMALAAIKSNKMRSFLTMLGIIIGISSVIAIVSIGDSMRGMMADLYKDVGVNRAYVTVFSSDGYYRSSDMYTLDDIERTKELFPDEIAYIDSSASELGESSFGRNRLKIAFQGIDYNYADVQPVNIIAGRMLNEADVKGRKNNVVLEKQTAIRLFGTDQAVGRQFRANIGKNLNDYNVVGIYEKKVTPFSALMMGSSTNGAGFIPYTNLTGPGDYFWNLNFYVAEGVNQTALKAKMIKYQAGVKNRSESEIFYGSAQEEMGMMDSILGTMSVAVGAIAAISLLVGGIGIMNIMLVSVTERTREIGIRKALGAKTQDVLLQFLTESAIISASGGIIGVLIGIGIVSAGGAMLGATVVIKPSIIFVAVTFSAVVGIFFGLYPASKAANADPIEALRYE